MTEQGHPGVSRRQHDALHEAATSHRRSHGAHAATFSLLYESRDGRLCLFQDKHGHLTAVRSDRFA